MLKIGHYINTAAVFHNVDIRTNDEVIRHGERSEAIRRIKIMMIGLFFSYVRRMASSCLLAMTDTSASVLYWAFKTL
jgi:hypothetical protein